LWTAVGENEVGNDAQYNVHAGISAVYPFEGLQISINNSGNPPTQISMASGDLKAAFV